MIDPTEVREQAFQAGIKTRGAVNKVKKTSEGIKEKIGGAIEGTIINAQEGLVESSTAVAESGGRILLTGFANKSGFWRGVWCLFGFTVVGVGLYHVVPPVFSGAAHITGGVVGGAFTGKPVNSSNGLVRASSTFGAGVVQLVGTGANVIGQTTSSYYQYQEINNPNQRPPSFVGGNIRAGGINPYPQTPVIPIQMQQTPQVATQPYNGNVYTPQQQKR